jgi:hypothetical protein
MTEIETLDITTPPATNGGAWTVDDDLVIFRRIKKILDQVPDSAYGRVREYLAHVLRERGDPPAYRLGAIPGSPR